MAEAHEIDINDALVKIYTEAKRYNYAQPWQAPAQTNYSGSGFVIEGRKILTSAHVIANHAHVEVRLANDAARYQATVLNCGHDCDLALMTVDDEEFWEKTSELELGTMPKVRARVNVWGFPVGGEELSITEGIASRIEVQEYVHSRAQLLTIQIDAAINDGNSGGPVLHNKKVVGVAHQGMEQGQNIGYIIPVNVIRHFLNDGFSQDYKGFPELACTLQPMENKTLREHFHMEKAQTGVRVAKIDELSVLKKQVNVDDLLLKINDVAINNDGTTKTAFANRVHLGHLITMAKIDDELTIDLQRNQENMQIKVNLSASQGSSMLVPLKEFDAGPTFYIFSGLIIQPLTINYLEDVWGENFDGAPIHLLHALFEGRKKQPNQQIVVINRVLSAEFNSGYREVEDVIIKKVNDQSIFHLKDVILAVEKNQSSHHVIETHDHQKLVVENLAQDPRHVEFLARYSISSDRSKDLQQQ